MEGGKLLGEALFVMVSVYFLEPFLHCVQNHALNLLYLSAQFYRTFYWHSRCLAAAGFLAGNETSIFQVDFEMCQKRFHLTNEPIYFFRWLSYSLL